MRVLSDIVQLIRYVKVGHVRFDLKADLKSGPDRIEFGHSPLIQIPKLGYPALNEKEEGFAPSSFVCLRKRRKALVSLNRAALQDLEPMCRELVFAE